MAPNRCNLYPISYDSYAIHLYCSQEPELISTHQLNDEHNCVVFYSCVIMYNYIKKPATFEFVQQYTDYIPVKDMVIESVHQIIVKVAQNDTDTNI